MQNNNAKSKEYFTVLKVIFVGMIFSQLIMLFVSLLIFSNIQPNLELNSILEIIVTLLFAVAIGITYIFTKQKMKSITEKKDLSEKLSEYRTLFIMKFAILEMPSILGIVSYILTGNNLFLIYTVLIILVFIVNYPSKVRIASEIGITESEL